MGGAAIIAAIRFLEYLARSMKNDSSRNNNLTGVVIACCAECLLSCLGDIVEYINAWAFVRVAIYGETFCTAGKGTWRLFKARGFEAMVADDLSSLPIHLGYLVVYLLSTGAVTFLAKPIAKGVFPHDGPHKYDPEDWKFMTCFAYAAGASVMSYLVAGVILSCIGSFVKALYVCWADDPEALERNHPSEAGALKAAANRGGYQLMLVST